MLTLTVLLFIFTPICSEKLTPPRKSGDFMTKYVVQQFEDYNLLVHFDNKFGSEISFCFATTAYFLNYDQPNGRYERPIGERWLNLVFLNAITAFKRYSAIPYNLGDKDIVIFFVEKWVDKYFYLQGVKWAGGIFIIDRNNKIWSACYYCGDKTGRLHLIFRGRGNLPQLINYLNNYSDFNGHCFTLAYTNFKPYFWMEGKTPTGPEGTVLDIMAKSFNFTYKLENVQSEVIANMGNWQAMIEAVHYNKVDWAVGGISVSLDRGTSTDFTKSLKREGFSILIASQFTFTIFTLENATPLLISIFLSFVIGLFSLISFYIMTKKRGTFWYITRVAMLTIVEQAPRLTSTQIPTISLKIVLIFWALATLSINSLYRSHLSSNLMNPTLDDPKTVDDLVNAGYTFQVNNDDWSVLKENLEMSEDRAYKIMLERIKYDKGFCEAVIDVLSDKVAIVDEDSLIQYNVLNDCPSIPHSSRIRLKVLPEYLFPNTYHGWGMQMGTPFRKQFNTKILKLAASGILAQLYETYIFKSHLLKSNEVLINERLPLSLEQIWPPILLLLSGLFISLVVFIVEICLKNKK